MLNNIFKWLMCVVYGIILPFLLIFLASTAHFELKSRVETENLKDKMKDSVDLLLNYYDDKTFFHSVLQKNFRLADNAKNPNHALTLMVNRFKKQFPDSFTFVIWDNNGRVNNKLSDVHKYRYLLKTMYKVIHAIYASYIKDAGISIDRLTIVRKKLKLLRVYFGKFLISKEMLKPFKEGYLGNTIITDNDFDKGMLWYQLGKNFSISCFISKKLMGKNVAITRMLHRFNALNNSVKLGAIDLIRNKPIGNCSGLNEPLLSTGVLAFDRASSDFQEIGEYLILVRQASPKILAFCYINKEEVISNSFKQRNVQLFQLFKIFSILFFILYCYSLRKNIFEVTIKKQLSGLFLLSNIIALLTLGGVGYEFFNYKRIVMINLEQLKLEKCIREFNMAFPNYREEIAYSINNCIEKYNTIFGDKVWDDKHLINIEKLVEQYFATTFYLINQYDNTVRTYSKDNLLHNNRILHAMFNCILEFMNGVPKKITEAKYKNALTLTGYYGLLHGFPSQVGRISLQNFSSEKQWFYFKPLGKRINSISWGILVISWSQEYLQNLFVKANLTRINKQIYPRKLVVMDNQREQITPQTYLEVKRLLHRTFSRKRIVSDRIRIKDEDYIGTSLLGTELSGLAVLAIYPREIIEMQIWELKRTVIIIVFIFGLLLFVILRVAGNNLISPLKNVGIGIQQIRSNNFNYKINQHSNDEFGELTLLLNETIQEMSKLAVGTAVQRNLLPPKKLEKKQCILYANSVFMTKMGGDYYDFFEIDDNQLCVFFGDVAGHGIPAGLVMGMAKSVIVNEIYNFATPADLLAKMNKIFSYLRKNDWRRAMTCQCVSLDCSNGSLSIANAGQCYPVVVSRKGMKCTYVKVAGLPMGSRSSRPYSEIQLELEPDETIVLYSDGIIEAMNADGEMLGYDRFTSLLSEEWDEDTEQYWKNILSAYNKWAQIQDDDITLLLIRRKSNV